MTAKANPCPEAVRGGRLRKAEQFLAVAQNVLALADGQDDVGDAYVTLCVHTGIAAADVICCAALGEHAIGENHSEAVGLLKTADREAAKHLDGLLQMKTKAGYTSIAVRADEVKRAGRAAASLLGTARHAHAAAG